MATVLQFPVKKTLPKEVEDHLHKIVKDYIEGLVEALTLAGADDPSSPEYEEIYDLVLESVVVGIYSAIESLDDES